MTWKGVKKRNEVEGVRKRNDAERGEEEESIGKDI